MQPVAYGFNFTEKKLENHHIPVTNETTRTWEFGEIVFFGGWIGNVVNTEGIPPQGHGEIDVNPFRIISTSQTDRASTYTPGHQGVTFVVQTNAGPGQFRSAHPTTGIVIFPARVVDYVVHPASGQFLELRAPFQNGSYPRI